MIVAELALAYFCVYYPRKKNTARLQRLLTSEVQQKGLQLVERVIDSTYNRHRSTILTHLNTAQQACIQGATVSS
jgi:ABC-type uncharacterized transport system substrate-binding protein